jgi:hypothetical protein
MADEKLPPHDIEAEEAVIGSLLIDPDAILKIAASKARGFFFGNKSGDLPGLFLPLSTQRSYKPDYSGP